ncbi:MAG: FAD-dependent monooxygenase [Gammaproteobacteria bacterium]
MQRANIAVCGCGPAGLAAALFLHRAGHRVRVFERFETPRPVGSGLLLQPTGLGVLAELGMVERLMSLGSPIDRIFGRIASSDRVVLDVRYSALGKGWRALAIHRAALFGTLHDAVSAAGIEIVHSARSNPSSDGRSPWRRPRAHPTAGGIADPTGSGESLATTSIDCGRPS